MDWRVKATVQKVLSVVPYGDDMHFLLQRKFGGLRDLAAECDAKIADWLTMVQRLAESGLSLCGRRVLEIGTGWYPTFPLCSYLIGAGQVITVDLNRLLKRDLTLECARRLGSHLGRISAHSPHGLAEVTQLHSRLVSMLERAGDLREATGGCIRYRAPLDARATTLDSESVDVIFSNSVLEHVPAPVIRGLMQESYRLLKPGGVAFHSINCGDHYAYVDPNVSQLNYLRFSEREWRRWNNRFLFQNRMRASELVGLALDAGFITVLNTAHPTAEQRAALHTIPVAACFRQHAPDELCITTVDYLGRKPYS